MARLKYNTERVVGQFNKMVKNINTRLKWLEEFDPDAVSLERYKGYFKEITTERPNYRTVTKMLKQAKKVWESGELSLNSGIRMRASAVETFNRQGYTFVNKDNVMSLIRFLDDARARGLGALYSSGQLAEAWGAAQQQEMTDEDIKKNMNAWAERVKKGKDGKVVEIKNPKPLKVRKYGSGSK